MNTEYEAWIDQAADALKTAAMLMKDAKVGDKKLHRDIKTLLASRPQPGTGIWHSTPDPYLSNSDQGQ